MFLIEIFLKHIFCNLKYNFVLEEIYNIIFIIKKKHVIERDRKCKLYTNTVQGS